MLVEEADPLPSDLAEEPEGKIEPSVVESFENPDGVLNLGTMLGFGDFSVTIHEVTDLDAEDFGGVVDGRDRWPLVPLFVPGEGRDLDLQPLREGRLRHPTGESGFLYPVPDQGKEFGVVGSFRHRSPSSDALSSRPMTRKQPCRLTHLPKGA